MSTIRDVAKKAGVSVGTVSNYLNGTCPISSATAAKIKVAIQQLQYVPNSSAKNLRSQNYREIGVLLPDLNDPYYAQILQGVENALKGSGYFLNIFFSHDTPALEQDSLRAMLSKQVCGLIAVPCQVDAWEFYYEHFTAKNRPVVMIDRLINNLDANFVSCSSRASIRSITQSLLGEGISDLLLLSGSRHFTCEAACAEGFREAFAQAGRKLEDAQLLEVGLSKKEAFTQSLQLLRSRIPRAILTTSGLVATGVIEALDLLGIPETQTRVISLGEEHWNRHTQGRASIYTSRPAIRLGNTAASLLLGQLTAPLRDTEHVILQDRYLAQAESCIQPLPQQEKPLRLLLLDAPAVRNFQGLFRNFTALHHIPTEVEFRPHNTILQEILAHRENYDLVMFDIPWLPSLVDTGTLLDLTELVPELPSKQFLPGCLEQFCTCQGRTYAMPFLCAAQILYYRKDLFEDTGIRAAFEQQYGIRLRPPLTLTEFTGIAEFFTHKADAVPWGISVAGAYPECLAPEIYFRLNTFGSRIYGQNNQVTFDNPQTLQAYINLLRSVKAAKGDVLQSTDYTAIDDFLRGETAMLVSYPILFPEGINLNNIDFPIGYSQVPGRTPLLGGWNMGIAASSGNVPGAMAFLRWMNSEPISNYFTIIGGQTAVSETYANDELISLYPWLPLYRKAYAHAQMPPVPNMYRRILPPEQLDEILCKWAYQAIRRDIDVQTAISSTQAELQEFLRVYDP